MTMQSPEERVDLSEIRTRLAGATGQQYWRSLEEVAETREFQEFLHREFPGGAAEWDHSFSRRTFLKVMGASLALAGLTACRYQPVERIAPYVNAPEQIVPGLPLFYTSVATSRGYAQGVLVESHTGRPTFISGNPEHPASLGAADIFTQAEILTMYDPERSRQVLNNGDKSTWDTFVAAIAPHLAELRRAQGAGLHILTQTVTSPTLASQFRALQSAYPQVQWHQYEPVGYDNVRAGSQLAFGEYVDTLYHFDQAQVILALDSDFLFALPGSVRYARDFSNRRRVRRDKLESNRLYVVESTPTITGAIADHRQPLRASEIERLTRVVAQRLGVTGVNNAELPAGIPAEWLEALVEDLQQHRGTSVVIAGHNQPPVVHALVHAINQQLDNVGTTLSYIDPVEVNPGNQLESLRALTTAMQAGQVSMLVMFGGNPVYDAPVDLDFANALARVGTSVHLSLFVDETSARSTWHIPAAHFLEAWGDARAFDGTASVIQPLIEPLYGGKSAYELVATLMGQVDVNGYDIVRNFWRSRGLGGRDFDTFWHTALSKGVIEGTAAPPKQVTLQATEFPDTVAAIPADELEILFQPDPSIWDGRFANNGWLQELPKPLTKLTWDNAALIGVATAERLRLRNGDVVELRTQGRALRVPVWIAPGHVDEAVTVYLGYGRERAGAVGTGQGVNAYRLRTSDSLWIASGQLRRTASRYELVSTQDHSSMEGREIVVSGTLAQFRSNPEHPPFFHGEHEYRSLYPDYPYDGPRSWGMVIDLSTCIGCNACVIACQAENNIPVVGKGQVANGREMHWLRIDRYYSGELDNPRVYFQPMACVHCEKAPCETVCPVAATVHDDEGINNMVYNRCVGTRYCSNNCPYKVRRFNFLQYADLDTETLKLQRNPNVTVRNRGVMEKCTYCIQRISAARIKGEQANQPVLKDGDVVTACQAACPTQGITFGNLNYPDSEVNRLKAEPLNYGVLEELNTRPRTTYLARVRNPNPAIEPDMPAGEHHGTETSPHSVIEPEMPADGHHGTE